MELTEDYQREALYRLETAVDETKKLFMQKSQDQEWRAGAFIGENWPIITAGYCGIEQTMKFLIAVDQGIAIRVLKNTSTSADNPVASCKDKNQQKMGTHDLYQLYFELDEDAQGFLKEYYERFQSLHSNIVIEYFENFLETISNPGGQGYVNWRYSLIEFYEKDNTPDKKVIPPNNPEVILEIWQACLDLARYRFCNECRPILMPDEKLEMEFCEKYRNEIQSVLNQHQVGEEVRQRVVDEIKTIRKENHPLNWFARVLHNYENYGQHRIPNLSRYVSEATKQWAKCVNGPRGQIGTVRTSSDQFVQRARGFCDLIGNFQWNIETNRFEQ